jgi:hypothetical protein
MPDPRGYTRATLAALAALGGGTCYWPDPPCRAPVTVIVNGTPVSNLEIAHIRAANPNGPRYDPAMTDEERQHWRNLIYLCTPHHQYVDRERPQDYPIHVLEQWKADREQGPMAQLQGLSGLTEDRLRELIQHGVEETRREVQASLEQIELVDPETAMILREATRSLTPDIADMLETASTEHDLHRDIAAALSFPDYHGRNPDALNDCMRDVVSQEYG